MSVVDDLWDEDAWGDDAPDAADVMRGPAADEVPSLAEVRSVVFENEGATAAVSASGRGRRRSVRRWVAAGAVVAVLVSAGVAVGERSRRHAPSVPQIALTTPIVDDTHAAVDALPGRRTVWTVKIPATAARAGNAFGVATVEGDRLRLYRTQDGVRVLDTVLQSPVSQIVAGTVRGHAALVWVSGGSLWWWDSSTRKVSSVKSPAGQVQLSSAGGTVMVSVSGKVWHVPSGGSGAVVLEPVTVPSGDAVLAITDTMVVFAASDGVWTSKVDGSGARRVGLQAPRPGWVPVRWVGVAGDGFVVVVWGQAASPSGATQVLVVSHRLSDGSVVDSTPDQAQVAMSSTWQMTTGVRLGLLGNRAVDAVSGRWVAACDACQMQGGAGLLVRATSSVGAGWIEGVGSGRLVFAPSQVQVLSSDVDSRVVVVQDSAGVLLGRR